MKSIEIQRRERSKWNHHAYYDDADLALVEAKRLVALDRYQGIRVIEDEYSDQSSTARSKYLFRSLRGPRLFEGPPTATAEETHGLEPGYHAVCDRSTWRANPFVLLFLLAFIVIGGLIALEGMQMAYTAL